MIEHLARLAQLSEHFDIDTLPPEVRQKLQGELIKLLREIGVQPRFHLQTGELVVPLDEMCRAMGMSEEEAREQLEGKPGCMITAKPGDVGSMQ
jgi:hypothetical protein